MGTDKAGFSTPLLPLTSTVVYPNRVVTVRISVPQNLALLQAHDGIDETIALGFASLN